MLRSFVLATVSSVALLSATSAAFPETQKEKDIVGEWRVPESGEVISIEEGGKWLHPKYGPAKLRETNDEADFKVYYSTSSTRCSYRVSFSDRGKTLNLIGVDPLQDPEYCPEGSLKRVDAKPEDAGGRAANGAQPARPAAQTQPAANLLDVERSQTDIVADIPRLTFMGPHGSPIHIYPTPALAALRANAIRKIMALRGKPAAPGAAGPLNYHANGSVMIPDTEIYTIFWEPPTLQNGAATGFSPGYQSTLMSLADGLPGSGLFNVAIQYFQTIGGNTAYIANNGGNKGSYIDKSPLPPSGCNDTATPGNCITDGQIQAEIQKVMQINGWTGGMNKIYMLFTSKGLGSCFDNSNASCAYTNYCGFHSFIKAEPPIIYANEPYGSATNCWTGLPSPNNDVDANSAASTASHEVMEAVTDPLLNAWWDDTSGEEIGDLCAWNFGPSALDGGKANQNLKGKFFLIQQEFTNLSKSCVQTGP